MAHVQKRAQGRWRARYRDPAGRERSKTFATKRDAEHWLDAVRGELAKGTYRPPSPTKTTFAELVEAWLASNPAKRPTTRARDRDSLRKFAALGPIPIAHVHPALVQSAMAGLGHLAPATVRTHYRVLCAVFSWAVEADLLDRSPCRGVKLPAESKVSKPNLSAPDLMRLDAEMPADYRAAVWLGALGLRQAEVFGLRVHSIDFLRRTVTVQATINEVDGHIVTGEAKNRSSVRTIAVPESVVAILAEHLRATGRTRPDDLVIQAPVGGPVRARNFRARVFDPAVKRAGLDGLTFHRLRHSAGHMMREAGVGVEVIQRRLGHASIATTANIYGSLPVSVDRAAAEALDAGLRAAETLSRFSTANPRPGREPGATS